MMINREVSTALKEKSTTDHNMKSPFGGGVVGLYYSARQDNIMCPIFWLSPFLDKNVLEKVTRDF